MTHPSDTFAAFHLNDLQRQRPANEAYLEFLRVPDLNCGLYVLPAGSEDTQSPHDEDEVYYILNGRARFRAGDQEVDVRQGSILYVKNGVEHRFHSIAADLEILVFFASGSRH